MSRDESNIPPRRRAESGRGREGAPHRAEGARDGAASLGREEIERYQRQLVVPELGPAGQARLAEASVLIVGMGGLGSPAAIYLAAAGVGRIGLVDDDAVERSNLQRQVLYGEGDCGLPKVRQAATRLSALNPLIRVEAHLSRLGEENGAALVESYDIILDGTDNFSARYLLNDLCVQLGKPLVSGSLHRFDGQVSVFWAGRGPCYRCLFPEPPAPERVPNCAEAGVLGVVPGVVGLLQATEVIKLAAGLGRPLIGRLLTVDLLEGGFGEFALDADPGCRSCGTDRQFSSVEEVRTIVGERCSTAPPDGGEIDANELARRLSAGEAPLLLDVREPWEFELDHIDGAVLLPLMQLPGRLGEIERGREIVTICKVGLRSARAAAYLREQGFTRVLNLEGGMDAWSQARQG